MLILGILAILAILHFYKRYKNQKLPPGPMGLPIFGYYFFLGENPMEKLCEVGRKYGNVFSLYIGLQYVVMLDDWEATREALNKSSTLDKPDSLYDQVPYRFGIDGTNGPEWVQTRRITSRSIKEIALKKGSWEDLLQEDMLDMVDRIAMKKGQPLEVGDIFAQIFINDLLSLIFGERLHSEDPLRAELAKAVMAIMEFTPALGMKNFSPTLSSLLQAIGIEKKNMLDEYVHGLAKYISDTVDSKIQNSPEALDKDSFVGRFQEEIENHREDKISYITVDSMKGNAIAILTGAGDTITASIVWTLVAMADHPDKQEKVHQELDSVIGRDGLIRWSEQSKVPYTWASLLESMRWKTLIPFGLRKASEDMQIQGFHIPKDTPILFNNWSIHNDTRYWETPERFMPERFLLEDGKKVNASPESYNPFSLGKRDCPGKRLALQAMFLMFTILMQKFKVIPKNGEKVEFDAHLGDSYQAKNVELRFIPR